MSLDLGAAPSEVEALAEVIRLARAALRNARLYGIEHPETRSAVQLTHTALAPIQDAWGDIELHADMEGLRWDRWRVTREAENREGLGRHLHREGISLLVLERGITEGELGRLLQLLGVNLSLPEYEEETLDHLLWQARLEGVSHRAVRSLREAEALSGDVDSALENKHAGLMEEILGDGELGERQQLPREIGEDIVVRAMEGADVDALREGEDLGDEEFPELEGDEELEEITARLRGEVEDEHTGMLVEQILILLRAATEGCPELEMAEAVRFAEKGLDEIYRRGLPVALLRLVDQAGVMLSMPPTFDEERIQALNRFSDKIFKPVRVARMLVDLQPQTTIREEDLKDIVERLEDDDFAAFLAWASEEPPERARWLMWKIGHLTLDRVERWVEDGEQVQYERLARAIRMLAAAGSERVAALRRQLVQHPGWPVREATLRWYADEFEKDDLKLVMTRVIDRHPRVRAAATDALIKNPDPIAVRWLRDRVQDPTFHKVDAAIKRDLCVTFGKLAGERAIKPLSEIVERRLPVFQSPMHQSMEAAVAGLVAVGGHQAEEILTMGAQSWSPARRTACRSALRELRGEGA